MARQYANLWFSTLDGGIDGSVTSLDVVDETGAPAVPFDARIIAEGANTDEIVSVTAKTGPTFTFVRASEAIGDGSQTASAHASGAIIEAVLTAGAVLEIARASTTSIAPSADTFLHQSNATTNYSTETSIGWRDKFPSSGSAIYTLMEFDISSLAGKNVLAADLVLITRLDGGWGSANAGNFTGRIQAARLLRAAVLSQATWNVYSTGNNWAGAGASDATDRSTSPAAVAFWTYGSNYVDDTIVQLDLAPLIRQLLLESVTTMQIVLSTDVVTGSGNVVAFHSLESATTAKRPVLNVVYA
jgi:hypothetical protein